MTTEIKSSIEPTERIGLLNIEEAFEVGARANELVAKGRTIIPLHLGEADFGTPQHVVDAGIRALRDGRTRYSSPSGLPELRKAIAGSLNKRGIEANPSQIVVTPGAKPILMYAAMALIEVGDEVLLPDPHFPIFPSVTRYAGGTPVYYRLDPSKEFAIDVDDLESRITDRTRVLFLNAPHNPTGGSVDQATLERIAGLVLQHDLKVISDEVYFPFSYTDSATPSITALPEMQERTIIVNAFSKSYAMTGWRLGYGLIPDSLVKAITYLAINTHSCVPEFVQLAGVTAVTGPDYQTDMVATLRSRRDHFLKGLRTINEIACAEPKGAFFVFPDFRSFLQSKGISTRDFTRRLLGDHGVATVPGNGFGATGDGFVRMSFAVAPEKLDRAVEGIRATIRSF